MAWFLKVMVVRYLVIAGTILASLWVLGLRDRLRRKRWKNRDL